MGLRRLLNGPRLEVTHITLALIPLARTQPHGHTARLGIVLNCVLREKDSTRYIETEVYGKLSGKNVKQLLTLGKTDSCTRKVIKIVTIADIYCVL